MRWSCLSRGRRLAAMVFCLVVVFLVGCGAEREVEPSVVASALAGTDDVALTYETDAVALGQASFGSDLRALVLRRLSAGRVGADVTLVDAVDVRVVVDRALVDRVDELLTWTGTLTIHAIDPGFVLPPPPAASAALDAVHEGDEVFYVGTRTRLLRAIEAWTVDRDRLLLAESLPGEPAWRTRTAVVGPLAELGDGALVGWGEGASLRLRGDRGSPAEAAIASLIPRASAAVVARGHVSLGTVKLSRSTAEPAIELSFGGGAEGYARAQRERSLLTTPRLPPLRRTRAETLPPNRSLAIACLVLPVCLSLAWLAFVRRFDRAHPEPIWLVGVTFLLGAASTLPAGLLELGAARLSPWLDPSLVTFGGQAFAFPLALVVFTVVVGLAEEGSKRLAAELAVRRHEFDEPIDGIVYGIVASLGFAAAENVRYFALGRLSAPLVIARCFTSVPAHMFFGAIWGYALGAKLVDPRRRALPWLLLAAGCHGLFDALLSTEDAASFAVVLNVVLASTFVVLVRSALRHGVVTPESIAVPTHHRLLFRVGRPLLFWLSAAALHVLAVAVFLLGTYHQLARHQPSLLFVCGSTVMLLLLAVAALGVSATVPLDVVVDAYGVTFAGAARPWSRIRGAELAGDAITLECDAGPLLLGPAPRPVLEAIAAAIETERARGERERR